MTQPATLLDSLAGWSGLWRHPRLFIRVHGGGEPPSAADLQAALLALEPLEPAAAWEVIAQAGDLAAAWAARELIPGAGDELMRQARRRFERRAEQALATAQPLASAPRAAVARAVRAARAAADADALEAERGLRRAEALAAGGVESALNALRRLHGGEGDAADPLTVRLRAAVDGGDLRLVRILAGRRATMEAPSAFSQRFFPLARDPWLERHDTATLLRWLLNPAMAPPDRLPDLSLTDDAAALLERLEALFDVGGEIFQCDAETLLVLAVAVLLGLPRAEVAADLSPLEEANEGSWAFQLRGPTAARLFPHAADDEGIALVAPRRPGLGVPAAPPGRGAVIFDVFERWRSLAHPEAVLFTPRMLAQALIAAPAGDARAQAFVRLQSSAIAVRPLILGLLGRNAARCRLLVGASEPEGQLSAAETAPRLAGALDLLVDEADIAALVDAAGDRLPLLLDILHLLAEVMDGAPADQRRFNALDMLLRPDIEDRVGALIETRLRHSLPDDELTLTALLLEEAAAWLQKSAGDPSPPGSPPGSPPTAAAEAAPAGALVTALVAGGSVASEAEGRQKLAELLALGVLRRDGPDHVQRGLPLPGRVLLYLED